MTIRSKELEIIKSFYGTIDIKGGWGMMNKQSVTYTYIIDLQ